MTVKKTVGPIVTNITGIGVSQMQKMCRHFIKVASGRRKAEDQPMQR